MSPISPFLLPYSWVAWIFLAGFAFQIFTNISTEIAGTSSLLDRLGFLIMFASGAILVTRGLRLRTILITPLVLALTFAFYNAIGITLTGDGPLSSLSTIFIPRYGYFVWMLIGLFAHLAVSEIEQESAVSGKRGHVLAPGLVILSMVFLFTDYIIDPFRSDSYQFAAMNAAMLFILSTLTIDRWRMNLEAGSPLVSIGLLFYLLGGSGLAYSVALMGATSIVLIWLMIVLLWMLHINRVLGRIWRLLLLATVVGAMFWFINNALEDFLLLTRFQAIETDGLLIQSVTSRLDLLPTFSAQFAISPIFGHSYADMLAGYDRGEYVHSVPLSLLSHAGLIGFTLFFSMFFILSWQQFRPVPNLPKAVKHSQAMKRRVFIVVFLIGSAVAFFSWLPLWFMLGYLMVIDRSDKFFVTNDRVCRES